MLVVCPDCGASGQEAGKYCENCGRLLDNVPTQPDSGGSQPAPPDAASFSSAAPPDTGSAAAGGQLTLDPTGASPSLTPAGVFAPPVAVAGNAIKAHFAVVRNDAADPDDGFTITRPGEFLVGRLDTETGSPVDIDLRQWVKPVEVEGRQQYLVHRHQCYLGMTPDGSALIRACQGAEMDTLVRPTGEAVFTSLQQLATVRAALPGPDPMPAYPLQTGDRLYMGDPEALHELDNPKAVDTYLMVELIA